VAQKPSAGPPLPCYVIRFHNRMCCKALLTGVIKGKASRLAPLGLTTIDHCGEQFSQMDATWNDAVSVRGEDMRSSILSGKYARKWTLISSESSAHSHRVAMARTHGSGTGDSGRLVEQASTWHAPRQPALLTCRARRPMPCHCPGGAKGRQLEWPRCCPSQWLHHAPGRASLHRHSACRKNAGRAGTCPRR